MKRTELKRKTPLKPGGPLKQKATLKRTGKLPQQSAKMKVQVVVQKQAYAEADDAKQNWCTACGKVKPLDHSHLFSQKLYPQHRNNQLNWQLLCRRCHGLFENHKAEYARLYPTAWNGAIARMKLVDPQALEAFKVKNEVLF